MTPFRGRYTASSGIITGAKHLPNDELSTKVMRSCPMRLISWNVANRVKKHAAQLRALTHRAPHIISLQEVTATTIPLWQRGLQEMGYHVITSFGLMDSHSHLLGGRKFAVLTASQWQIEALSPTDFDIPWRERVLSVMVHSPWGKVECHNAHLPAGVSHGWIKIATFEGIYKRLACDGEYLRILCGDFNSPQMERSDGTVIPFGEHNERWSQGELSVITGLAKHDLRDVYRVLHGFEKQEKSWVMQRQGKQYGRRFDHVFASRCLNSRTCTYLHSLREQGLSDHSPIEVCFAPETNSISNRREKMNGLLYDMDVRTTDPNATGHRRAQFHQGWDKALAGAELTETTLRQLTWHNLGYRLGKLFGPASDELIDQMYDWCVAQQET